jgi:hypothetical protein
MRKGSVANYQYITAQTNIPSKIISFTAFITVNYFFSDSIPFGIWGEDQYMREERITWEDLCTWEGWVQMASEGTGVVVEAATMSELKQERSQCMWRVPGVIGEITISLPGVDLGELIIDKKSESKLLLKLVQEFPC